MFTPSREHDNEATLRGTQVARSKGLIWAARPATCQQKHSEASQAATISQLDWRSLQSSRSYT